MTNSQDEILKVYDQLCISYRAIDDFRAKLLGFLPLATGTGIFLLAKNLSTEGKEALAPIAGFGFLITLGLFSYEIYGIRKCAALIETGERLEGFLAIQRLGQFAQRPQNVARLINEPFASGIIYPAVLAAWTFVALVYQWRRVAVVTAVLVFLAGFVGTLIYDYLLRKAYAERKLRTFSHPTPELPVADVERAQQHYHDAFGFEINWLDPEKEIGAVSRDNVSLFFRRRSEPFEPAIHWVYAPKVDAAHEKLRSYGARIVEPLEKKPWGLRQFTVEDIDGNRFYFHCD